jgi:hypothetical protein
VDGYRVTRDVPLPYIITQPTIGPAEDEDELLPDTSDKSLRGRFRTLFLREQKAYDTSDEEHAQDSSVLPDAAEKTDTGHGLQKEMEPAGEPAVRT